MTYPTPVSEEETPLSEDTGQPSEEEPTDTVESLKEKLAAETEKTEKAEEDAKRWKNRVKEENPPKEKEEEDYADWRIDNRDRILVPGVKEKYEEELEELESSGAKLTNAMREKALRLAEGSVGVKTEAKEEPIPQGEVDRGGQREPVLTDTDRAFNVKPETKKKYADQESQWE